MSNTIDWGKIHYSSWSPETNLTGTGGSSFSNTKSIELDGVDDYVETNTTYSELDGATALTISFWAKSTSATTSNVIHIGQSPNRQVYIAIFSLGRITFVKDETNPTSARTNNSIFPHDSNWHHVMICVDLTQSVAGQRCRIFLDSNDVTGSDRQLDNTAVPTSTGNLYLNEANKDFTGNIDEVAIWSGTDLRNDVATIYNSAVPNNLNDNGLTAPTTWWRFEGTGTTATDSGSGGNNGTLTNGVTRSTDVPT